MAWTLKGALYFCRPQLFARTLAKISVERAWQFQVAGAVSLLLGLVVGWIAYGNASV